MGWPLSDDCSENYEHGKFMVMGPAHIGAVGDKEVPSLVHGAGLHDSVVKVLAEYFNLTDNTQIVIDLHDMHRLLQPKDLDIAQVTLFAP